MGVRVDVATAYGKGHSAPAIHVHLADELVVSVYQQEAGLVLVPDTGTEVVKRADGTYLLKST
jgi:hypothetical protein